MTNRIDEHGFPLQTERHIAITVDLDCPHFKVDKPPRCMWCEKIRQRIDEALLAAYTEGAEDMKRQLLIAFDRGRSQELDLDGIRELMDKVTFTPMGETP